MYNKITLKVISFFIACVFLLTNCAWAENLQTFNYKFSVDKLAASSFMKQLGDLSLTNQLGELLGNAKVMEEEIGVRTLADLFDETKKEALNRKGIMSFVDTEGKVRYVFNSSGVCVRITKKGEQILDDLSTWWGIDGIKDSQGDVVVEWFYVTEQSEKAANALLGKLGIAGKIDAINPVRVSNMRRTAQQISPRKAEFVKAFSGGDAKALDVLVNDVDLYAGDPTQLKAAEVTTVEDFLTNAQASSYQQKAVDAMLDGTYVPEFFFAGAATRLKRGPMWNVDFWSIAEAYQEARTNLIKALQENDADNIRKYLYDALDSLTPGEFSKLLSVVIDLLNAKGVIIDKKKNAGIEEFKKNDIINAVIADKGIQDKILDAFSNAKPIDLPADRIGGLKLGERQLIQYYVFLQNLAQRESKDFQKVLENHRLVIHVNDDIEEDVKRDLLKNNFYGFKPSNILIVRQPVLPLYVVDQAGNVVAAPTNEKYVYGHGYATEQLKLAEQSYWIDANGVIHNVKESVISTVKANGALYMGTHRINDLTRLTLDTTVDGFSYDIVDLDKLALSIYLMDNGYNISVELVDNPEGQKGGLWLEDAVRSFLLEGMNTKGDDEKAKMLQAKLTELTREVQGRGLGGIPYNAFRLVYKLSDEGGVPGLDSVLADGLPNSIRTRKTKDGKTYIQLELVTGDITRQSNARARGIMRKSELIHDFKEPKNLIEALRFMQQDSSPAFRTAVSALGRLGLESPLAKQVTGVFSRLWEADMIDGRLVTGNDLEGAETHAKFKVMDRVLLLQTLNDVLAEIAKQEYGEGILAVTDAIRVVDNIDAIEGVSFVPYAKFLITEDGKRILLLDIDAIDGTKKLNIVLDHELKHSVLSTIPNIPKREEELTANYMSLKLGLEMSENGTLDIDSFLKGLEDLGKDAEFFRALQVLREQGVTSKDDEKIAAVAIQLMNTMDYYRGLFDGFNFERDWRQEIKKMQTSKERYEAAIRVLDSIVEAKAMATKVKENAQLVLQVSKTFSGIRVNGLNNLSKQLSGIVSASVKTASKMNSLKTALDRLSQKQAKETEKFCLVLDKDRIPAELADEWAKEIENIKKQKTADGQQLFNVVYSIEEATTQGYTGRQIIHLKDPADLQENMTEGILYLPMPYLRSSLYMAAMIVVAGGDIDKVDQLVKGLVGDLYSQILGRAITAQDLENLFKAPWLILPEIRRITGDINNLRKALVEIEKAA